MKKVLFIASTGGHLNELLQLKALFKEYDSYLITEKDKSTESLQIEGIKETKYLTYGTRSKILVYPFIFIYNCFKSLFYYFKIKPKVIITTGTHL